MTAATEPVGVSKCFPDHLWKHYLKIAIFWVAVASAVASQNDLKIQLLVINIYDDCVNEPLEYKFIQTAKY